MPRNRLPRVMKRYSPTGRRIMADVWRDFWIRETGTGQQVAQLHDRYMMMMISDSTLKIRIWKVILNKTKVFVSKRKFRALNECFRQLSLPFPGP